MKGIFYTLVLSLFFVGCDKGPDTPPIPLPEDPPLVTYPELHLTTIKKMLPLDKLANGARAIFINQFGVEKILYISFLDSMQTQHLDWEDHGHHSVDYLAEVIKISYIDSAILNRSPWMWVGTQYRSNGEVLEFLTAAISGVSYFPEVAIQSPYRLIRGDYLGQTSLNGRIYDYVYTSWDHASAPASYSRLYYNWKQGIIAFEGYQGQLWTFDRFEN